MRVVYILLLLVVITGCTAPYRISDRPTYSTIQHFKNKFTPQDKIILEIDNSTKSMRVAKGPSDLLGAATIYDFNVGEAFSSHFEEICSNIFILPTDNMTTIKVAAKNNDLSFSNTLVHTLGHFELDMTVTVSFLKLETAGSSFTRRYHTRVDIPFSERAYGVPSDAAAVSAIDRLIEDLVQDLLSEQRGQVTLSKTRK